jgi:hypothetical protein
LPLVAGISTAASQPPFDVRIHAICRAVIVGFEVQPKCFDPTAGRSSL